MSEIITDVRMIRNANVVAEAGKDHKNQNVVKIYVGDDGFQHTFDANSRVSKALDTMPIAAIQDRLSGGQFFYVEDTLVDFRDRVYDGFVHSDESIKKMIDVLGVYKRGQEKAPLTRTRNRMFQKSNLISKDYVLGAKWSDHPISLPQYKDGGEFNSELNFVWNPFTQIVNTAFAIYRLICLNGAVGLTNLLNTRIPLINLHKDNLEIANRQIQAKLDGMVRDRLSSMGHERATV